MASIQVYANGAGGSTGADLAVLPNVNTSGFIWYVHKSGSNSNTGKERTLPVATLAQAITNSSAYDTIVLLSGHTEVVGSALTVSNAGITISSEGTGSTRAALTGGVGSNPILKLNATGILVDNIDFPASTVAVTERVQIASTLCWVRNCTFESGVNDTARALSVVTGAGNDFITNCTFTAQATGASIGISIVNAVTGLIMDSVTFDGGAGGYWSDYAFKGISAVTGLRATRMSQLNGSHVILATGGSGIWQKNVVTGDSRLQWTP